MQRFCIRLYGLYIFTTSYAIRDTYIPAENRFDAVEQQINDV